MTGEGGGAAFPRLFTPLRIGSATLRNRIVSSGHDTVMAEHGLVSDRLVAYQEARARGGVGLIVIQVAGVHPTARYTSHELTADDDRCIPGFTRLAEVAHANGAVIFGQLFHGGREIMDTDEGTLAVALAPSAVPTERFHVMPRAMPVPLIREIVGGVRGVGRAPGGRGPRRLRGRRLARLPAVAVPQPAHEPADRRVRRRSRAPAPVPARRAGGGAGRDAARVRRRAADLDRRGHGRRPERGRGGGGPRDARRRRGDGLRERRRRHLRDARGLRSHRAADAVAERLHGASRGAWRRRSCGSRSSSPGGSASRRRPRRSSPRARPTRAS